MAYEDELFFGSLFLLFAFVAYRFEPQVRALLGPKLNATAAATATHAPLAPPSLASAWALSRNELLVCAALLALTLLSFVLFTKKRRVLREQRRRAKAKAQEAKAGADLTPEAFLCTVPSREDYKNGALLCCCSLALTSARRSLTLTLTLSLSLSANGLDKDTDEDEENSTPPVAW